MIEYTVRDVRCARSLRSFQVTFHPSPENDTDASSLLGRLRSVAGSLAGAELTSARAEPDELAEPRGEPSLYERLGRRALRELGAALPPDALVLLAVPHLEFNQDFLNRVSSRTEPTECSSAAVQ